MSIMFTVSGQPKGKGRPRFTRQGRTYTPEATREYEDAIKTAFLAQGSNTKYKAGTPLKMEIVALYGIPKSDTKKVKAEKESGKILPTIKPDLDNLVKIVADALNGLAYDDDKQITNLMVAKRYWNNPGIVVRISEVTKK